jgi:hypothetical protein
MSKASATLASNTPALNLQLQLQRHQRHQLAAWRSTQRQTQCQTQRQTQR